MTRERAYETPFFDRILHPSDFTAASETAFAHALKAALIARARLTLFHVSSPDMDAEWSDFPGVRQTLERWGLLPPDSAPSAVPDLGIEVEKIIARDRDPVAAVLRYLETHPADLIVLAPHRHDDASHWFHRSVSEPVARRSGQPTLFVPDGVRGFVSGHDGSVSLTNILIPVAAKPRPLPAVEAATRLVSRLSLPAGTFTVLHVGAAGDAPAVHTPSVVGWRWDPVTRTGDVIDTILDTASSTSADLIVMTTDGRHGFLDALRGSHSERVLRHAPCPLLVLPATSTVSDALKEN
jgi:nucleotide-binding universal stress UspA family protein